MSERTSPAPAGRFSRALVVWKKSRLTEVREENNQRMLRLIAEKHVSVADVVQAHEENEATVAAVSRELTRLGIAFTMVHRDRMEEELRTGTYDLVLTAGGDGTVLDVSHFVGDDIPVLGVNSAPSSSHGHWCLAVAADIGAVLDNIVCGRLKPQSIMRLQLTLDGKPLPQLVLNEVLIAQPDIGDTSRYILTVGKITEAQKSDGLFVGAPGGCTGWMRSYGAELLPITSRRTQFLARGLIVPPGTKPRLRSGLLTRKKLTVISQMREGKLRIDGRHIIYDFPRGAELTISNAKRDLRLFIDATVNERYYGVDAG